MHSNVAWRRLVAVIVLGSALSCEPVVATEDPPTVPRVCNRTVDGFNECAQQAFASLAAVTGGAWWKANSASQVPSSMLAAIDKGAADGGGAFDLMIIIDRTSSMADDIGAVIQAVDAIIARIQARGDGTQRVGLFAYGDICADGPNWGQMQNLTTDLNLIRGQLRSLTTVGGGDVPESVYDAVAATMTDASWQRPNRFALLIGDAGPQESGDPCYRTTYGQAVNATKAAGVQVNMYPILVRP